MGKLTIPDRWEQYESVGKRIPGTRFITFKVPLRKEITESNKLGPKEKFSPHHLQELLQEQGLNLGLVIDLTFTDRYYHPKEFQRNNVEHMKIKTQGKAVPNRRVCKKFLNAVDKFLEENKENDHLIGVHCTHGVNRTGYLVCRYMIDKLDFQPEEAIEACGTARGYNIERENYLDSLKEGKTTYENVQDDDADFEGETRQRQNGRFDDQRGRHFNEYRGHHDERRSHDRAPRGHDRGQWGGEGQNRGYRSSRGYPNEVNSFNPRDRGGYGNGYQRQSANAYSEFAPKRFGHHHDNINGYNSPNTAAHQQSFAPRTFGYQHSAGRGYNGPSYMQRPPVHSYSGPHDNYNNGRQRPYERQGSWHQERPEFSRQNSASYSYRDERRHSSNFSQKSNRRDFNPYSQYNG